MGMPVQMSPLLHRGLLVMRATPAYAAPELLAGLHRACQLILSDALLCRERENFGDVGRVCARIDDGGHVL